MIRAGELSVAAERPQASLTLLLERCVGKTAEHRRLLATFARLENIGACKIHRFQRFGVGGAFVLKHAAEEARHAWHFTRQLARLSGEGEASVLAPHATRSYLRRLDVAVNRYLQTELGLRGRRLYLAAYLLDTLVIELRAAVVYPLYRQTLKAHHSPVSVNSVIQEETQHLAEMQVLLTEHLGAEAARQATEHLVAQEHHLFAAWLEAATASVPIWDD